MNPKYISDTALEAANDWFHPLDVNELLLRNVAQRFQDAIDRATAALREDKEAVVKVAVECLGNSCQPHTDEICKEGFDEFVKSLECLRCVQEERDHLKAENQTLRRLCNGQELQLKALGASSDAVAVIGEPVHPAILERDELLAENEVLRQQLQQPQL